MICFRCFIADHMIMSDPVCSVWRNVSDCCILWRRMWDNFFFFKLISKLAIYFYFIFFLDVVPFYFAQLWCRWDASSCVPFYFIFVNGANKFFYEAFCGLKVLFCVDFETLTERMQHISTLILPFRLSSQTATLYRHPNKILCILTLL